MTTMTVEYECCGASYRVPIALRPGSLLLANAALGDTLIALVDASHDQQHPECSR